MSAVERDIKRIVVFFEGVSLWKRGKKREREDDTQGTQSRLLLTKLGNLLDLPKAIPPNGSNSDSDSHIVRVVILKKTFLNRLTASSFTALASFLTIVNHMLWLKLASGCCDGCDSYKLFAN